jgi:hypothetical protein
VDKNIGIKNKRNPYLVSRNFWIAKWQKKTGNRRIPDNMELVRFASQKTGLTMPEEMSKESRKNFLVEARKTSEAL